MVRVDLKHAYILQQTRVVREDNIARQWQPYVKNSNNKQPLWFK